MFFQALREIAKAARVESRAMFAEATRKADEVRVALEGEVDVHSEAGQMIIEQLITEIQDRERRRKSVASVGTSCLHACAPLLASQDIQTCLLALGVIEASQNVTKLEIVDLFFFLQQMYYLDVSKKISSIWYSRY